MKIKDRKKSEGTEFEEDALQDIFNDPDLEEDMTTLLRRTKLQNDVLLKIREQLNQPLDELDE